MRSRGCNEKVSSSHGLRLGGCPNTSASATTIVTDGSFQNGLTGWKQVGFGTTPGSGIKVISLVGPGSTVYGDSVPPVNGANHAAYFVDDNAFEILYQTVSLAPGTDYTLSFDLFATVSGSKNPNGFSMISSIGGEVLGTLTNKNVPVAQWTDYTYTFTAPASTDTLGFTFLSGATPAKDVLLTAVNIAAVPEPSSWAMMILGFVGVGFMAYRKKNAWRFA